MWVLADVLCSFAVEPLLRQVMALGSSNAYVFQNGASNLGLFVRCVV